jgi:hemolysin activation/secretion protein
MSTKVSTKISEEISDQDYTVITRNIYENDVDPKDIKRLIKYLQAAVANNGFITTTKGINDQKIFRLQQVIENLK